MRIYHISDSHGFHSEYKVPTDIDVVCFTGDESNHRNTFLNHSEFLDFVKWYAQVPVEYKLYIPGNHSTFVYHNEKEAKNILKENGIIWLNKEEVVIDGVKFYGDGISPTFGDWVYMCKRETIGRHWELIPDDVNVLLTHTPPKGILDLTETNLHTVELCGCSALRKRIISLSDLMYHCFGHIHNGHGIENIGLRKIHGKTFSNAAGVEDGKFSKGLIFNGNILEI